jgi:hypothetical protein
MVGVQELAHVGIGRVDRRCYPALFYRGARDEPHGENDGEESTDR